MPQGQRTLFGVDRGEQADETDASDAESADKEAAQAAKQDAPATASGETIRATPDFWTTLAPLETDVLKRLYANTASNGGRLCSSRSVHDRRRHVQRQTQRWLQAQGFECRCIDARRISGGRRPPSSWTS